MRFELPTRAAAEALSDYLQRCECSVTFVNERTLEAAPRPRAQTAGEIEIELDAYIRVWQAMHADERITVLDESPADRTE